MTPCETVLTVPGMQTRKQRFNSQVSETIVNLKGRVKALTPLGWTRENAAWNAIVCLHSGAFTRTQCARFLDAHSEQVRRVVHALIAGRLAAEETPPGIRGIGRVYRIYARTLYRALGTEPIRHRRNASPEVLMRRLLSLDYVIEHPSMPWLTTEAERVAAFESLGIERGLLPVRVYQGAVGNTRRYFPIKLPVALDNARAVSRLRYLVLGAVAVALILGLSTDVRASVRRCLLPAVSSPPILVSLADRPPRTPLALPPLRVANGLPARTARPGATPEGGWDGSAHPDPLQCRTRHRNRGVAPVIGLKARTASVLRRETHNGKAVSSLQCRRRAHPSGACLHMALDVTCALAARPRSRPTPHRPCA